MPATGFVVFIHSRARRHVHPLSIFFHVSVNFFIKGMVDSKISNGMRYLAGPRYSQISSDFSINNLCEKRHLYINE